MGSPTGGTGTTTRAGLSLLLVDDDVALGESLCAYLGGKGITLEVALDGRSGLDRALRGGHDMVLLDVMLPGLDGLELLRQIRRQSHVPVIMVTGRTAEADRIRGLEAGADDYLPKPFLPEELVARIRAVLRRAGVGPAPTAVPVVLEAGPVQLIPAAREVRYAGLGLDLTTTEFDILELLVRAAGRVVSRDELTLLLYHRKATPLDRALDVHISHLRKKLGGGGGLIQTVRGSGYRIVMEREVEAEAEAEQNSGHRDRS